MTTMRLTRFVMAAADRFLSSRKVKRGVAGRVTIAAATSKASTQVAATRLIMTGDLPIKIYVGAARRRRVIKMAAKKTIGTKGKKIMIKIITMLAVAWMTTLREKM